jgi:hypothetical protein
LINLLAADGSIVRLWQSSEPCEVAAAAFHMHTAFAKHGLRKVDGQNIVENRANLNLRWKVYMGDECITSYATEPEVDVFLRKMKDMINSSAGTDTLKRTVDI